MLYRHILKSILFRFDPELIHDRFICLGEILGKCAVTRKLIDLIYGYHSHDISKIVDGINYQTPILLSAGFDYNGHLSQILPHIGLGGEEVGSVTARPCAGNRKPRLTRLPRSRSIIVNKGLCNDGVDAIIERLKKNDLFLNSSATTVPDTSRSEPYQRVAIGSRSECVGNGRGTIQDKKFIIGISIARTNDPKSSESVQAGIDDYVYSFKRLNEEAVGDYYTINISCPNAFGGESFTDPTLLEKLLIALKEVPCAKPVYVKMPITIADDKFKAILSIVDKYGLQGVIIGNLNKDYSSLDFPEDAPKEYSGGLSGKPCRERSNDLIKMTRKLYGSRFTIIGVGGIMSPEDAQAKFDAGADLIQLITGMIYQGPGLIKKIAKNLAKRNRGK